MTNLNSPGFFFWDREGWAAKWAFTLLNVSFSHQPFDDLYHPFSFIPFQTEGSSLEWQVSQLIFEDTVLVIIVDLIPELLDMLPFQWV